MSKAKNVLIPLLIASLLLFYYLVNPSQVDFLLSCPLYYTTEYYCPGCGSQRAFHQLVHGNFLTAINSNILFVLGLIGLVYHYGVKLINYWSSKRYISVFELRWVKIIGIISILIFWLIRNIPHYPFTLLAPNP